MKNGVHHTPDGFIVVRSGTDQYNDTLANFTADYGVTFPPLPQDAIERIYIQGVRHSIIGDDGVMGGGPMPWPFGNQLINNIHVGIDAQTARQPPPPLPPDPPAPTPEQVARRAQRDAYLQDAGRNDLSDRLKTATPAQIDAWVDANVTTIAQARQLFKAILKTMLTGIG